MKTLHATVAVTLDIFFFVYVDLRCIANKQKKISKMSTFPPPGKIFADALVGGRVSETKGNALE